MAEEEVMTDEPLDAVETADLVEGVEEGEESLNGTWRSTLSSCFEGCTERNLAPFWMGFCCSSILSSQVMTRMELDFVGDPGYPEEVKNTFKYVVILTLVGLAFPIFWLCFIVFTIFLGTRLRRYMRQKYHIPTGQCGVMEDCIFSTFCCCCSGIQMARHTHDEHKYSGEFLKANGLPLGAPELDVENLYHMPIDT
jgi:Cys-rich protein (TIGR01571 family)